MNEIRPSGEQDSEVVADGIESASGPKPGTVAWDLDNSPEASVTLIDRFLTLDHEMKLFEEAIYLYRDPNSLTPEDRQKMNEAAKRKRTELIEFVEMHPEIGQKFDFTSPAEIEQ